jgi:phosphoribosylformylglycinamidine synthase subunit PurS
MKATVHVTLKPGVLDPQGQTIRHAAAGMGFTSLAEIRQGKYFEIALADDADPETARAHVERLAREILSNPVIEDYRVELSA